MGPESVGEFIEEETFAFPFAVFELCDFVEDRWRIGEAGAFGEPLADTGASGAGGNDADGHVEALGHGIAERRDKAAASPAGATLGIVGDLPFCAVEGSDHAGLHGEFFRTVIGGV